MLRFRSRVIGGWLVGGGLLALTLGGACADNKGAIMLAINTDMRAPKDVNAVSITISEGSTIKHSFIGRVTPQGEVLLPATLAVVEPDDKNASIRIRVMAFQNAKPRVLRDIRTTVPPGRTALLRIPLNFIDDGMVMGPSLPAGIVPDPVPGTEMAGGATTKSLGPLDINTGGAADFDFFGTFQPPCPDIENQTIIDGQCADSAVDSSALPDFDQNVLSDSTDPGTCFDVSKCLGTPATVKLDTNACTLQLNGASADQLNIALVTPDTGDCLSPGQCYIPIDRGPAGWQDAGGSIQLPKYVCTLVTSKKLSIVTSTSCAAKQESNPICTPKSGDNSGGGDASAEGGDGSVPLNPFVVAEDLPTTVAAGPDGQTLYFAGASRVAVINVAANMPTGTQLMGTPLSGHLPWRFGHTENAQLPLVNGGAVGYIVSGSQVLHSVTVSQGTVDATNTSIATVWAVTTISGPSGVFTSPTDGSPAQKAELPTAMSTSVASVGETAFLVGNTTGEVTLCDASQMMCGGLSHIVDGRLDAIAVSVVDPSQSFVLAQDGVYKVTITDPVARTLTSGNLSMSNTAGINDAGGYYPRGLAVNPKCVFFSSTKGIEYVATAGAGAGVLVPAAGKTFLGVATGIDPRTSAEVVYYTQYSALASGGGIYRAQVPPECVGLAPPPVDSGAPGPNCSNTCKTGCCTLPGPTGQCIPFIGQNASACGQNGNTCAPCNVGAGEVCNPAAMGGICQGG